MESKKQQWTAAAVLITNVRQKRERLQRTPNTHSSARGAALSAREEGGAHECVRDTYDTRGRLLNRRCTRVATCPGAVTPFCY